MDTYRFLGSAKSYHYPILIAFLEQMQQMLTRSRTKVARGRPTVSATVRLQTFRQLLCGKRGERGRRKIGRRVANETKRDMWSNGRESIFDKDR